jgi:hypothetical protein
VGTNKLGVAVTVGNHATKKEVDVFVPDSNVSPPYSLLVLGILSFSSGIVFTCIGKVLVRFRGWVYRAEEPKRFWAEVQMYYLGGVFFIGYFLYLVNWFSN